MTIERKLLGTVDAGASQAVYIEDVMATYLYNGTGASQTINNGIDLATKGGMVWIKCRQADGHKLFDTVRGAQNRISSSSTAAQASDTALTSFTSTGYVDQANWYTSNTVASWTFRKQSKFFDIVTYTGNGASNRSIAHNLGATPGMIIVKCTSVADNWAVYHKSLSAGYVMLLNTTAASASDPNSFTTTAPTSTNFYVSTNGEVNGNGNTFVAYLFADSNSGGFGPAGTDSVVACGSYSTSGTITLGWEPQFIIIKKATNLNAVLRDWTMFDNMRGLVASPNAAAELFPNTSGAEVPANQSVNPNATGFTVTGGDRVYNGSDTYIYLAIRRGPMKTPTDATKVFAPVARTGTSAAATVTTGFPVDMTMIPIRSADAAGRTVWDRLRSGYLLRLNNTASEENWSGSIYQVAFDNNTGVSLPADSGGATINQSGATFINYNFRRAPGFFDVVCYTGTGSPANITHNLSVEPNLIITKRRNSTGDWWVYGKTGGFAFLSNSAAQQFALNTTNGCSKSSDAGDLSLVTSTTFSTNTGFFGGGYTDISGATYVSYLFATCPGVSKVFSFTGNGSSQTIGCGFAAGARFVLIKRTDAAGDWWVYDSARGIVSAADPALRLNSTAAEVTSADAIDPASSGFIVNQEATCNVNVNNATYIGLAIA